MRGLRTRAAILLGGIVLACEPPPRFEEVAGHPGKKGVDGGLDGSVPPPPGPVGLTGVERTGRASSRSSDCSECHLAPDAGAEVLAPPR